MDTKALDYSAFRIWSIGIVLEDKPGDGDLILVNPMEQIPDLNGPMDKDPDPIVVEGKDHRGIEKKTEIKASKGIVAKWIPGSDGNRQTAPNVCARETVLLYKYADTDDVYWMTVYREPSLRRLEHIIWALSNRPTADNIPFDNDTSIVLLASTREKKIHLRTPKNDGEFCRYEIDIDLARGYMRYADDVGQDITIDSQAGSIVGNATNLIQFNAARIELNGTESVKTKAPVITDDGDTLTYSGQEATLTSAKTTIWGDSLSFGGNSMTGKSAGDFAISSSGGSVTVASPTTVVFNTPLVHNTGDETTDGASYANPHYKYAP